MTKKSVEMTEDKNERVAVMNPSAVEEAKVYNGPVHYHNGDRMINLKQTTLVEVGKWSSEGGEKYSEDFLCTYYAALLLGFETDWLPYNEAGDRKLFIGAGTNEKNEIISFSEEQATKIAAAINQVYNLAKNLQAGLIGVNML